jgi:hypothetical protein
MREFEQRDVRATAQPDGSDSGERDGAGSHAGSCCSDDRVGAGDEESAADRQNSAPRAGAQHPAALAQMGDVIGSAIWVGDPSCVS